MPKHTLSYDGIYDAIKEGSMLTRDGITDYFEGEIEAFLDSQWKEYFVSEQDLNQLPNQDMNSWTADLRPELVLETWDEMSEYLGSEFDIWVKGQKVRINLSVGADIPYLLTKLAGGERVRGEYVTKLIREVIQNQTDVEPDIQALRLEVMGLDGRLRTLERQVVDLSRR